MFTWSKITGICLLLQKDQHHGQHDTDAGGVQQQPGTAGDGEDGGAGPGETEDGQTAVQHAAAVSTILTTPTIKSRDSPLCLWNTHKFGYLLHCDLL